MKLRGAKEVGQFVAQVSIRRRGRCRLAVVSFALMLVGCGPEYNGLFDPLDDRLGKAEQQGSETLFDLSEFADPNKLEIVITGDGYTADEQELLRQQAKALTDRLMIVDPFSRYGGLLRIRFVPLISARSGLAPEQNPLGCSAMTIRRAVCDERRVRHWRDGLGWDVGETIVLLNVADPLGGAHHKGRYITAIGSAPGIAIHELAHAFGLADEYIDVAVVAEHVQRGASVLKIADSKPNCSTDPTRWAIWQKDGSLGEPEAGCYYTARAYSPSAHCKMRYTTEAAFCVVCREFLVAELYRRVGGPLIKATPEPSPWRRTPIGVSPTTFRLDLRGPRYDVISDDSRAAPLIIEWKLDGRVIVAGSELSLSCDNARGASKLSVTVRDPSRWVRSAAANLALASEQTWWLRSSCR
ncbi:MAG: hypothetical protein H6707_04640 [Deltaproteobacteria bacterium]|nr:hypothetical protein [Deltaproteobacteria bacterium]